MSFADRFGYARPERPRTLVERDSDAVRLVLWNVVSGGGKSSLAAYRASASTPNSFLTRTSGVIRTPTSPQGRSSIK